MTTVVHCKRQPYDIYIGRPSKWGNPIPITNDRSRAQAIREYKIWFMDQDHLIEALPELKDKVLGCWCRPQACHGDFLAELANSL